MTAPWSCAGCDTHWRSLTQAHCSSCHLTFSGVTAFDRHRSGGRCRNPARLRRHGQPVLAVTEGICGPVWGWANPTSDPRFPTPQKQDLREST